jgi:hypothetical protein
MGYYSTVKAVIKFDEQVRYATFVANMKAARILDKDGVDRGPLWRERAPGGSDTDGDGFPWEALDDEFEIRLSQDDVKWYDGYYDVDAAMSWIRDKSAAAGAAWRFVRLGEEYSDIEEDSSGNEDIDTGDIITVHRSVSWG